MVPTSNEHGRFRAPSDVRADLHCHSTASQVSKLGVQRSAGLPECATPPEEVYELAKRRGMDFVTITDHDTIDGVMQIADRPDVFVSEELTAWFRGEAQAVHILTYGITPDDHEWLQAHARDVEACSDYLHANHIACALAHPFYAVEAPLTPWHRRRLARLFEVWEIRNGSRAPELNMPAAVYIETHGGTGVAGSDDHAGVDIGRTWTRTPVASTPEEFLSHLRAGRAESCGEQGSAAKWAHSALALASRSLLIGEDPEVGEDETTEIPAISPSGILRLSERVVSQGSERTGPDGADFSAGDARALLRSWLATVGIGSGRELLELMQADEFTHSGLQRRARAAHEVSLAAATHGLVAAAGDGDGGDLGAVLSEIFAAILPVVPYAPAASLLAGEKRKLSARDSGARRAALVVDSIGSMHGVAHTIERLREAGVPGYELEVIGTDPGVDRRLPAVAEVEIPYYEELRVGVPSIPALVETLTGGGYELIHVASPGPAGLAAALVGRIAGVPCVGSHHTELVAYAGLRSGSEPITEAMRLIMALLYGQCELVLSPSSAADRSLAELGVPPERVGRWSRGVDTARFDPGLRDPSAYPGEVKLLYAGRQSREKGVELLAEAFLAARERDPRLHLLLAGGGPEQALLRERLGEAATFLGWQYGTDLARTYASADAFVFASQTDTYGQVVVEAQASGLPVVAVAAGGPVDLIDDGEDGILCPPERDALAEELVRLAASPLLRRRLAIGGLNAARSRTWGAAMQQLADGYDRALGATGTKPAPAPAPQAPAPLIRAA